MVYTLVDTWGLPKLLQRVNFFQVDLSTANPERVKEEMSSLFDIDPSSVLHASAKTGLGVTEVLDAVVDKIPPPDRHGQGEDLRLLLQVRDSMPQ